MFTNNYKIAITGATGFLGGWAAHRFIKQGYEVLALGRSEEKLNKLRKLGAETFQVDLSFSHNSMLTNLLRNTSTVIHCAGLSSLWGKKEDFFSANVLGTQNILTAATQAGVERFIHISTPSIYVTTQDRQDISENYPLPKAPINDYAWSKLLAEKAVDQIADAKKLFTITLRPQAIIGPGDPSIFPRILKLAQRGIMPMIGHGNNLIDLTCIENVVDAILLALQADPNISGQKFNITNGESTLLYENFSRVFNELGYTPRKIKLPFKVAFALAAILEKIYHYGRFHNEPALTRYSVCLLGRSRTLSIENAKNKLAYTPRVLLNEGIKNFILYLRGELALEDIHGS